MWMMVMFDLPVASEKDRKNYTEFRNALLDNGFEMSQFSVYLRFCGDRECSEKYVRVVKANAPPEGNVSILFFTDKQFGQIINIVRYDRPKKKEIPDQLTLF